MDVSKLLIDIQASSPQLEMDRKGVSKSEEKMGKDFAPWMEKAERPAPEIMDEEPQAPAASSIEPSRAPAEPSADPDLPMVPVEEKPDVTAEVVDPTNILPMLAWLQTQAQTELPAQVGLSSQAEVTTQNRTQDVAANLNSSIAIPTLETSSRAVSVVMLAPKSVAELKDEKAMELPIEGSQKSSIEMAPVKTEVVPDETLSKLLKSLIAPQDRKTQPSVVEVAPAAAMTKPVEGSKPTKELLKEFLGDNDAFQVASVSSDAPSHVFRLSEESLDSSLGEKLGTKLKDMASGLFIQKNLDSNLQFNFEANLKSLTESQNDLPLPEARVMTQHLAKDMEAGLRQMMVVKEGGQMTLHLRPGHLGQITVDVKIDQGQVRVGLLTEKASTESVLKAQSHELKSQLQSIGLKVEEVQVQTMRSSAGQESHQDRSHSWQDARDHSERHQHKQSQRQAIESSSSGRFEDSVLKSLAA